MEQTEQMPVASAQGADAEFRAGAQTVKHKTILAGATSREQFVAGELECVGNQKDKPQQQSFSMRMSPTYPALSQRGAPKHELRVFAGGCFPTRGKV